MRGISLALILILAGCTNEDPVGGACGNGFNAESGAVGEFGAGSMKTSNPINEVLA